MEVLASYLKKNIKIYLLFVSFILVFFMIFYLYSLSFEALYYGGSFCFIMALLASVVDFYNYKDSYKKLQFLENHILNDMEDLPRSLDVRVEYYHKIIRRLHDEVEKLNHQAYKKNTEIEDYFSMWVHQIKTPIAALNFLLDNEEVDVKIVKQELFKIERYVEMVLTYLRLGSESSDYLIEKTNLGDVTKDNIKK